MTVIATLKSNSTSRRALRLYPKVEGYPIGYVNPASFVMNATEKKVLTVNGEGGTGSLAGDEWYFVVDAYVQFYNTNNYGQADGWVAAKHKGEWLLVVTPVTDPTTDPEPPTEPVYQKIVSVTAVYEDGHTEDYVVAPVNP